MTAQTWDGLQTTLLAALAKAQPPYNVVPVDFATLFPQATSYAENRIYRDIVFLAERTSNSSLTTSAGSRVLDLSTSPVPIIVPEGFALITPAGQTSPASGTRVPYDQTSLDVIDQVWPVEATTLAPSLTDWSPRLWALKDDHTLVYCPTADGAYTAEITGLFTPTPISGSNQSTYLSINYPDLMQTACMVFLTGGLLHNFGAQGELPDRALSWEALYSTQADLAWSEERRKRGLDPDVPRPGSRRAMEQKAA